MLAEAGAGLSGAGLSAAGLSAAGIVAHRSSAAPDQSRGGTVGDLAVDEQTAFAVNAGFLRRRRHIGRCNTPPGLPL